MTKTVGNIGLSVGILLLISCSNSACPSGYERQGDVCVVPDSGALPELDGGVDAGDACGGTCSGATPYCYSPMRTCVECLGHSQCPAPRQMCMPNHMCARCDSAADCPLGQVCDPALRRCTGCASDADCSAFPALHPRCDATSTCVECIDNADCPRSRRACFGGQCQSCVDVGSTCTPQDEFDELVAHFCSVRLPFIGVRSGTLDFEKWCVGPEHNDDYVRLRDAVSSGNIVVDESSLRSCLDQDWVSLREVDINSRDMDHTCEHVLVGTLPNGAACDTSYACTSHYCARTPVRDAGTGPCGVCTARVPVGGSCGSYLDFECVEGAYCGYPSNPICQVVSRPGDSCGASGCHGGDLYCVGGVCLTRSQVAGATCSSTDDLCGFDGTNRYWCDHSTSTCAVALDEGAPCSRVTQCASGICQGGSCRAPAAIGEACTGTWWCVDGGQCTSGVCVALPGPGSPCSPGGCGPMAVCIGGAGCATASGPGGFCYDDRQCPTGYGCHVGCAPFVGPDEPCDDTVACGPGLRCLEGFCSPLPDLGEPCDRSCLRGTCTSGTCSDRPLGAGCADSYASVDPCGVASECTTNSSGVTACLPSTSGSCDGTSRACEHGQYCDSGSCVAYCHVP